MELNSDLVGFRFEYDTNLSIDLLQAQNNKTYLVYIAQFQQANQSNSVAFNLDIIDCQNPSLIGFKCLDFSKISNYTFSLDTQNNLQTSIIIMTYGCLDLDSFKTFIPDNCANQTEIDNVINGINGVLRLKLYTSQFNTTSQEIQANYRNTYIYTIANQSIASRIKTQKQVTKVKKGLIIQSEMTFSSPIQYDKEDYNYDRTYALENIGFYCFSQANLYPDELVQQIQIEFPTLPQIFAQVNSILTLLMLLGVIGRAISRYSIKQDFFMLFFKHLFQANYLLMQDAEQTQQQIQLDDKCQEQFQQHKQETLQVKTQQLDQKDQRVVEINQLEANNINEEEEEIKNQDEISQSKSIPLFCYTPSLIKSYQNQNNNLENQEKEQKSYYNSTIKLRKELIQINQKGKLSIENDSPRLSSHSIIQKSSMFNKQTSRMNSETIFSIQSQKSKINDVQKKEQNHLIGNNLEDAKKCEENKQFQCFKNQSNKEKEEVGECLKKLSVLQDRKVYAKMKKQIFRIVLCKKRYKSEEIEVLSQKQQQRIDNQISQDLSILNFIKDMIFLKKAVMLLLRKDQLAALNLVGFSTSAQELDFKNIHSNAQLKQKLSYYEMQYAILQSEKLQQHQLEKFLKRCQKNLKMNDIDERILNSLLQNSIF
ncbi:AMP-binding enzyme family protein (macronuclear) [Tetrahymena thermophila SB210]|uniref:AMP-binding enzyme family protein n=1 Tax=Tetrahymena thermophila (strain SB210) TaxID=312017 RepID=W7XKN2_TETTS|nr:AMP-binding enzyme family protein [Tetrahymena thermophila SB210]EWS75059.1 AMP-binding enzyme family protein [Tetrahymena thermophila SB210]|eukprot:XP_012652409.1 AMP-binding enzyme family protein [Tetrahymena thermophila SB210]